MTQQKIIYKLLELYIILIKLLTLFIVLLFYINVDLYYSINILCIFIYIKIMLIQIYPLSNLHLINFILHLSLYPLLFNF